MAFVSRINQYIKAGNWEQIFTEIRKLNDGSRPDENLERILHSIHLKCPEHLEQCISLIPDDRCLYIETMRILAQKNCLDLLEKFILEHEWMEYEWSSFPLGQINKKFPSKYISIIEAIHARGIIFDISLVKIIIGMYGPLDALELTLRQFEPSRREKQTLLRLACCMYSTDYMEYFLNNDYGELLTNTNEPFAVSASTFPILIEHGIITSDNFVGFVILTRHKLVDKLLECIDTYQIALPNIFDIEPKILYIESIFQLYLFRYDPLILNEFLENNTYLLIKLIPQFNFSSTTIKQLIQIGFDLRPVLKEFVWRKLESSDEVGDTISRMTELMGVDIEVNIV